MNKFFVGQSIRLQKAKMYISIQELEFLGYYLLQQRPYSFLCEDSSVQPANILKQLSICLSVKALSDFLFVFYNYPSKYLYLYVCLTVTYIYILNIPNILSIFFFFTNWCIQLYIHPSIELSICMYIYIYSSITMKCLKGKC